MRPDKVRWEHLDFWNVKVLFDAAGTPLSGKGLTILTRGGPDGTSLPGVTSENVQDLRDDLWIWTLENAREIATLYQRLALDTREPRDALYAPLRTLAALLAGNVPERSEAALNLQTEEPSVGPAEQVLGAARFLVRQGYAKRVSLIHLRLELERLDLESGDNTTDRVKLWRNPRWLGRALRQKRVVDPEDTGERRWLWGQQTRVLTLATEFVSETLRLAGNAPKYAPPALPLDFCTRTECRECSYRAFCPLRSTKEQKIKTESER